MRKASTLVGLTLVALGAGARAQETAPAAPGPAPAAVPTAAASPAPSDAVEASGSFAAVPPARRLEVGLAFLPMGLGRVTVPTGITTKTVDAGFAYGASVWVGYRLVAGLSLGLEPQVITNVNSKVNLVGIGTNKASNEYDVMLRIAYTQPIFETVGLYVQALPGYSLKTGDKIARGFILALGGGVSMGLTDRTFANIGVGYQLGYQVLNLSAGAKYADRENYVRMELGGGVRF
jgi:hypothetical protein